jgi:predicted ATPase
MHTFKNFKNFADAEIDLSKPMTLLIGRNGSGKSNVIEGVELLAELLKGREIQEISDIGRGGRFEIRGSLNGCFRQGYESFELGFKDKVQLNEKEEDIYYNSQINLKPSIHIENPYVRVLFSQASVIGAAVHLFARYDKVSAFDIYPHLMRRADSVGLSQLNRNGVNISSVLYYLKQNKPDILEKILERIRQLPEEAFESFEFITTSDNSDVLFALKYPNGEIISAKLLSDGTLRALAILTALETVPEGSRIIIEEIDNGVHASRVHVLIDAIWEASNRRHLNTLITTHNPATLDSLNDEQLECVVVCHYDKQSQSAKLTPFFELPRVDVLLQKGKLGGLVTRNVIERYLDPDFEKEQQRIATEWLESLK